MAKLTTGELKSYLVAHIADNERVFDIKMEDVKNWRREIKKTFKDEGYILRVFECWVGWTTWHGVVKTPLTDDTILSFELNIFDGTQHYIGDFYGTR
jgi:hypothetical protein